MTQDIIQTSTQSQIRMLTPPAKKERDEKRQKRQCWSLDGDKGSKPKNAGQVHACLPVPGCHYLPASKMASVGIRCWTGSKWITSVNFLFDSSLIRRPPRLHTAQNWSSALFAKKVAWKQLSLSIADTWISCSDRAFQSGSGTAMNMVTDRAKDLKKLGKVRQVNINVKMSKERKHQLRIYGYIYTNDSTTSLDSVKKQKIWLMADVGHRMIVLHQYVHNNLYSDSGSLRYKTDYKARLSYVSCLYLFFLMRGNGKVIGRRKKVGDI